MEQNYIPFILMGLVFWFFMIRPQMKRQKKQKKFIESLAVGQDIVTDSGISAKIISVNELTCILELKQGQIEIQKNNISVELTEQVFSENKK